ncbi:MAG: 6-phosphogluconolactonase [Anaerolinea sp.]|nr:6-phosphogluconolactonase [Anaerolinea sp.]
MTFRVYATRSAAAHALATNVVRIAERAIAARDRFTVAFSGGNTPRDAYKLIASDEYVRQIAWAQTYAFLTDERSVPLDSPENNGHMIKDLLLNHVPMPLPQIFRIQSQNPPEQAASDYEAAMKKFFTGRLGQKLPKFDLIILGLGEDGHITSLFPGTAALAEQGRWVVANHVPQLDTWRITLTYPVINAAANIIFYVLGEAKADILKQALTPPAQPENALPVHLVRAPQITWIVDKPAASKLQE